jgi:RimJ/RimL family protein N-acetyltransferase
MAMPSSLIDLLNGCTFTGNRIHLVQASEDHAEGLRKILNDPVTMAELPFVAKLAEGWSLDEVRERVKQWQQRRNAGRSLHLVVLRAETGAVAGWCGFNEIVQEHRRAEFGVVLEASSWGRGAGVECILGCLEFGFESLALHRVDLNTMETNVRAIRLAQRIGAVSEGVRREHLLHEGQYFTSACFSLLAQEWPSAKERIRELLAR